MMTNYDETYNALMLIRESYSRGEIPLEELETEIEKAFFGQSSYNSPFLTPDIQEIL